MKEVIDQLNKAFESRVRLGIMSALMVNHGVDFLTLKELLNVTDGNLASHIAALEKEEYISIKKEFAGKKTRTTYTATAAGKKAFNRHLNALETLVKKNKK